MNEPTAAPWTRRRWLRGVPAAAALGVCAPVRQGVLAAPAAEPVIAWPPLQTLAGATLEPGYWQGVPAVVVFWATWCAFCRRHNAHLHKLHQAVDAGRLRVLGVALDSDAAAVRAYLRQTGYVFPVVVDGSSLRRRFTTRRVIPMPCCVAADGRLLQTIPGEMSEGDVMELARLAHG